MDAAIVLALVQEGLTSGAIYSLIAVALVLVFVVTRVIFVQAGEFISFGAFTLYLLQGGRVPWSLWFMVAASACVFVVETIALVRRPGWPRRVARVAATWLLLPCVVAAIVTRLPTSGMPMIVQILLSLAIVTPLGPAMYRLGYQRIADAPVLTLLIVSVAIHFVLDGLALIAFGPDGARTAAFTDAQLDWPLVTVPVQSLIVLAVAVGLVVVLYAFSRHTMLGYALRATASNRRGASLMGIANDRAGMIAFTLGAFISALAGILISPFVTLYYNSGFLISLKAFVGAVVGAMVSYPLAAAGALGIGVVESFTAFWSSAYKDVLVFAMMVPILLGCSLLMRHGDEEDEEELPARGASRLTRAVAPLLAGVARIPPALLLAIGVALLVAAPLVVSRFQLTVLSYIALYTLVVYGVVLLTGVAGQVSFGQAAFVGVGAYTSAFVTKSCAIGSFVQSTLGAGAAAAITNATSCGLSAWWSLPVSVLVTCAAAWLLGSITLRMRGHFLPIATIAWAVSLFYLFANTDAIGGSTGLTDIPAIPIGWLPVSYETATYFVAVALAVVGGIAVRNLLDSRTGRAIRTLKNRTTMAGSAGIHTARLKVQVFIVASIFAALAGWLYASMQRFVNPSPFGLNMGVEYVFMAVVGGAGQVAGAVLGSATVRILNDLLQDLLQGGFLGRAGNFEMIFFGILIVVMLQRTRGGLATALARMLPPARRAVDGAPPPEPTRGPPSRSGPLLEVRAVTKRFGGLAAIDGVSFTIGHGEILALIGPNGAGKSTMFNLVTAVTAPTSGEVVFDGRRIDTLASHAIATAGIARTFQHVKLLGDRTVLENAMVGAHPLGRAGFVAALLRRDRREEASLAAEAARQLRRVGLGDALHVPAASLPLGKQRILEIARALAARPRLLLLDEPAAGLRHAEKQQLAAVLRELRDAGMSILLVEHDMAFVMGLADRIVVQNFGRKLAEGDPAAIQAHPDVRAAYLGGAA